MLIVLFDEDDFSHNDQVYMAMAASQGLVKTGFSSSVLYNHYSMLKTIEQAVGLGTLTANDAGAIRAEGTAFVS